MLEARGLSRSFGSFQAVSNVHLALAKGEIVGLLGRNGAGKTSTIEMLAGHVPALTGSVRVDDIPVADCPGQIGYLPEGAPLWSELTIAQTLQFGAGLAGLAQKAAQQHVDTILHQTGLHDLANQQVGRLSKGQHRRTALAFALLADPPYLLLDEPFDGFDPVQQRMGRELLRNLRPDHGILVCTHALHEAEALCDRVMILHKGEVIAQGHIADIACGRDFGDVFAEMTKDTAKGEMA